MGQAVSPARTASSEPLLRHDMKPDRTGWTVYDVVEGRPVCLGGVALKGLSDADANEVVDVLNRQDLEIERSARRLVTSRVQCRSGLGGGVAAR